MSIRNEMVDKKHASEGPAYLTAAALSYIRKHGIRPLIRDAVEVGVGYLGVQILGRGRSFFFRGKLYHTFIHLYNVTWYSERAVEIPIVREYLEQCAAKKTLEVGNVLSHYINTSHDIVDKYETAPGIINKDIVEFEPEVPYDLIISVSTLEHVGWDETPRDHTKISLAVNHLISMLSATGKLVITLPIGYNPHLDVLLEEDQLPFTRVLFLKRVSRFAEWVEVDRSAIIGTRYGSPFRCANAIAIGIVEKK